ncbi:MAG: hypothetical protein U9Q12_03785 [Patescibacteria group bacterium]|nr:hypothetical protein [Patescibacteria group bacterium]
MRKIFFALGIFVLVNIFVNSNVLAEEMRAPMENRQPLEVMIKNVQFDEEKHQMILDVDLANNTSEFISGLQATLSVFKGEQLKESGFLFEGLDLIYATGGEVQDLAPQDNINITVTYDIPSSVESGTYFIQYGVTERELKYHGINYFKDPINVVGSGGFIGNVSAFVRSDGSNQDLMDGRLLKKDQDITIIIPLIENPKLIDAVNTQNQSLFTKAVIRSTSMDGDILKELPKERMTFDSEGKSETTIKPWEDMPTGTMTIELHIIDKDDNDIANSIFARWFRAERVSRVAQIITQTNSYKKGNTLDLTVVGSFLKFNENDKFIITVDISADGENYQFTKDHIFKNADPEEIKFDFSDQKMPKNAKAQSITVMIKDEQTGEIFDKYIKELNQDGSYVAGQEMGMGEKFSTLSLFKKILIIFSVLVPVIVIIYLFVIKKRNIVSAFILSVGIASSILFVNVNVTHAVVCPAPAPYCTGAFTSNNVWASYGTATTGNLGDAPCTINITDIYAHMDCDSCLNGVLGHIGIEVQKSNGTPMYDTCNYLQDPGHKYSWKPVGDVNRYIPPGPFEYKYTVYTAGSYRYRLVMNTSEGCKCFADSYQTSWIPFTCTSPPPPEHGACGSKWSNNIDSPTIVESKPTDPGLCDGGSLGPSVQYNSTEDWNWRWGCQTPENIDLCYAKKPDCTADIVCGPSHNKIFIDKPTSGLCNYGNATVSGNGPWNWQCSDESRCNGVANCQARKLVVPGVCESNATRNDYSYTEIGPDNPLCLYGHPSPASPLFSGYGTDSTVNWTCSGINAASANCTAQRQLPTVSCGTANGTKTNQIPQNNLCSASPGNASAEPLPEFIETGTNAGKWVWGCEHSAFQRGSSPEVATGENVCKAESCLSDDPLQYKKNVILAKNGQNVTIGVECPDSPPGSKVCCYIEATAPGEDPITHLCEGNSVVEAVIPDGGLANHESRCYFENECTDPPCCEDPNVNDAKCIPKPINIKTMCIAKECNSQGTCQATPVVAQNLSDSQCKSSCNSDADCSSGRMIETKP